MELVFISSPYRGDIERNIVYAKELLVDAITAGYVPIAPHLLYPQVLDDNVPEERKAAIELCHELLKKCDAILIGKRYGLSSGMKQEIITAKKLGKRVIWKND